jgi:hypothetical protein
MRLPLDAMACSCRASPVHLTCSSFPLAKRSNMIRLEFCLAKLVVVETILSWLTTPRNPSLQYRLLEICIGSGFGVRHMSMDPSSSSVSIIVAFCCMLQPAI